MDWNSYCCWSYITVEANSNNLMYKQIWCCTEQAKKKSHGMWPIDIITHGQLYNWYELECVTPLYMYYSFMKIQDNTGGKQPQQQHHVWKTDYLCWWHRKHVSLFEGEARVVNQDPLSLIDGDVAELVAGADWLQKQRMVTLLFWISKVVPDLESPLYFEWSWWWFGVSVEVRL